MLIDLTYELYAASIPKHCKHQTITDHMTIGLCPILLVAIECGKKCDCDHCGDSCESN